MSELYSDTSRFARDLDAWITRDDRPECDEETEAMTAEIDAAELAEHAEAVAAHEAARATLERAQRLGGHRHSSLLIDHEATELRWVARIEGERTTWESTHREASVAVARVVGMSGGSVSGEAGLS